MLASCGGFANRDVALEGAFAATMVVDALQTKAITAMCRESNPVIGACGERASPLVYFPLVALVHVAITASIPRGTWRNVWQAFSFGVAVKAVHTNYSAGIEVAW
jgi:hypothetical protein